MHAPAETRRSRRPANFVTVALAALVGLRVVFPLLLTDDLLISRLGLPGALGLLAAVAGIGAWGWWGPRPAWDWQAGPWGRARAAGVGGGEGESPRPLAATLWLVAISASLAGLAAVAIGACTLVSAARRWPAPARPGGFPWDITLLIDVSVGEFTIVIAGLALGAAWYHAHSRVFGACFGVWPTARTLSVAAAAALAASAPEATRWIGAAPTGAPPAFGPWTLALPACILALVAAGLALVFGARGFALLDAGAPTDPAAAPPPASPSRRWFRR